jgi:septum site-determining protein MinC
VIGQSIKIVEFKSAAIDVVQLQLRSLDLDQLQAGFELLLGTSPDFFDGELAVVDLDAVEDRLCRPEWAQIRDLCAGHGLNLVGVANARELADGVRDAGLAAVSLARTSSRPAPPPASGPSKSPERAAGDPARAESVHTPEVPATLLVERPLRSGQQLYGRGRDVVLLAQASVGSEVIADGSIHVYAPLRGRALAGAHGDTNARIITTCFEPELVSIGGIYRTFEDGIPDVLLRRPVQVRLTLSDSGEPALVLEPLTTG